MFALSLIWLGIGLLLGALALGGRLRPAAWVRYGRLRLLGLGAAASLAGGWLGALVLGRLYGTPTAIWVAVLALAAPQIVTWLRARLKVAVR